MGDEPVAASGMSALELRAGAATVVEEPVRVRAVPRRRARTRLSAAVDTLRSALASGSRPASERGHGAYRRPVNTAGIDLSDPVFAELGMKDNDVVEWRFVHRDFTILPRL